MWSNSCKSTCSGSTKHPKMHITWDFNFHSFTGAHKSIVLAVFITIKQQIHLRSVRMTRRFCFVFCVALLFKLVVTNMHSKYLQKRAEQIKLLTPKCGLA